MKLRDAVKFVKHNGCSCCACDIEHYAKVVKKDGSTDELTREIINIYEDN